MKSTRTLLTVGLLAGALGCTAQNPATKTDISRVPEELPSEQARTIIQDSSQFRIAESTLHVLEWQMDFGEEDGLWAVRKRRTADGRTEVTVDILDGAREWVESAEYFAGGVVPLHLARPISRHIVTIESIVDAEYPQMKEVQFTWTYSDTPEFLARLKPQLKRGPYAGAARLQFQEDSWEVIGRVRESRIPL